jgi:thiol-disulfide isomerase/thioredoxin
MKTLALCLLTLLILCVDTSFSQDTRGTTDDGQSVVLRKNGTWFFVNQAPPVDANAVTFDGHVVILNKTGKWILTNTIRAVPSPSHRSSSPSHSVKTASYVGLHPFLANNANDLTTSDGTRADLERITGKKLVLLYFSAHWCPPCRAFTPRLVSYYNNNGGGDKFEILFVSCDRTEAEMTNYMKLTEMPWVGVTWKCSGRTPIEKKYCGPGIPCLVMLNEQDEVTSDSYVGQKYVGPMKVLADLDALLRTL